jgi:hypothetical protein
MGSCAALNNVSVDCSYFAAGKDSFTDSVFCPVLRISLVSGPILIGNYVPQWRVNLLLRIICKYWLKSVESCILLSMTTLIE